MLNYRHVLVVLAALLMSPRIFSQVIDENAPRVEFACDITRINDVAQQYLNGRLTEHGGLILMSPEVYKNNGSMGLCVVKSFYSDDYYAYDMLCPICVDKGIRHYLKVENLSEIVCERTGAEASTCFTTGSAQMSRYDHGTESPHYLYTYIVERHGNILYIHSWEKPE